MIVQGGQKTVQSLLPRHFESVSISHAIFHQNVQKLIVDMEN